jgi:hypothetical protein
LSFCFLLHLLSIPVYACIIVSSRRLHICLCLNIVVCVFIFSPHRNHALNIQVNA